MKHIHIKEFRKNRIYNVIYAFLSVFVTIAFVASIGIMILKPEVITKLQEYKNILILPSLIFVFFCFSIVFFHGESREQAEKTFVEMAKEEKHIYVNTHQRVITVYYKQNKKAAQKTRGRLKLLAKAAGLAYLYKIRIKYDSRIIC